MPRLILLLVAIGAGWYAWQYIRSRPPAERKRLIWTWGSMVLIAIALLLVATGRMHWVGAAIAAALPALRGLFRIGLHALPMLRFWQKKAGPSRIRTAGLEVVLDIANGKMRGQIFQGPHADRNLEDLPEEALQEQLRYFREGQDRQSALLLRAYMVRRGLAGAGSEGVDNGGQAVGDLSREEAWQILGLEPGVDRDEIIKAHKRLIQKLHPDRGGSDYLAAKINAAKDRLLDSV